MTKLEEQDRKTMLLTLLGRAGSQIEREARRTKNPDDEMLYLIIEFSLHVMSAKGVAMIYEEVTFDPIADMIERKQKRGEPQCFGKVNRSTKKN